MRMIIIFKIGIVINRLSLVVYSHRYMQIIKRVRWSIIKIERQQMEMQFHKQQILINPLNIQLEVVESYAQANLTSCLTPPTWPSNVSHQINLITEFHKLKKWKWIKVNKHLHFPSPIFVNKEQQLDVYKCTLTQSNQKLNCQEISTIPSIIQREIVKKT